jgi:hypothetical protein
MSLSLPFDHAQEADGSRLPRRNQRPRVTPFV